MMEMTERVVAELAALKARVANLERLEKSSFASHAPVTLDMNSVQVNRLTGQELGLQVQPHNFAWLGPAAGAPDIPTFRAITITDAGGSSNPGAAASLLATDDYGDTTVVDLTATGGLNVGTATGATEGQVLSSGAQLASAGSAAVPSHGTTGDADTGMYFPFANYLGFATGGRGLLLRAERQWIAHSNVPTLVTTYSVAGDAQNYWHVLIITTSKSTGASAFSIDIFIKCSNPIVMHTLLHSALNAAPYLALPDVHYEPTDHTIRVYQTAVANDDGATQYDIWVFATQGAITS